MLRAVKLCSLAIVVSLAVTLLGFPVAGAVRAVSPGAGATTFYFAEGTCRPGFETYFTIQNPGAGEAAVTITYMKGDSGTADEGLTVPPQSRCTVNCKSFLGERDDAAHDFAAEVRSTNGAPIVVERPMYFNYHGVWNGGHDVMGATAPAICYYFAEASARPGFDPYITIMNPGAAESKVWITYYVNNGDAAEQKLTVAPHSRATVRPKDVLLEAGAAAHDFAAKVGSYNDQPIVAELPMYFDYRGAWTGGSDVMGFAPQ